jgi:hypothetical protein
MLSESVMSYKGPLSFGTIDILLSEFKQAAEEHALPFKTYKKMISLMIEAVENVSRYSDQFSCDENMNSGFCPSLVINMDKEIIELVTRNPVRTQHVDFLRSKIDQVNDHDLAALKEHYRSVIADGKFTSKGGAGLGFIDMAKTTGKKLEYSFENLNSTYSLYTFRAVMDL